MASRDNGLYREILTREVLNFIEMSPFEFEKELWSSPQTRWRTPRPPEDYDFGEREYIPLILLDLKLWTSKRIDLRTGNYSWGFIETRMVWFETRE